MGAFIYKCPHCGEIIDNDSTSKCKKCGKFLAKVVECKIATAINPEFGMICSILRKRFSNQIATGITDLPKLPKSSTTTNQQRKNTRGPQ